MKALPIGLLAYLALSLVIAPVLATARAADDAADNTADNTADDTADDTADHGRAFGLKAGLNFSRFEVTDMNNESRVDLVGGGYFKLPFGAVVGLQAEVLYSRGGFRNGDSGEQASAFDVDAVYSMLAIPLLLRFDIPRESGTIWYVYTGPELSFVLDAQEKSNLSNDAWESITAVTTSPIWSVALGGGLEIGDVAFDLRYVYGLSDLDATEDPVTRKVRIWSATIGVRLF